MATAARWNKATISPIPWRVTGEHSGIWCANAGIYSLRAASLGYQRVVAFDISPKCITYVLKSAKKERLRQDCRRRPCDQRRNRHLSTAHYWQRQ